MRFSVASLFVLVAAVTAEVSFNSKDAAYGFDGQINGLSDKCKAAYSEKLPCSELLIQLRNSTAGTDLLTEDNLNSLCKSDCINALNIWDKRVQKDCNGKKDEEVLEDQSGSLPEYYRMLMRGNHEVQENLYWTFCLQDQSSKEYCILKDDLPAWPSTNAKLEDKATFCKSSCRAQQSYLVLASAESIGVDLDSFDPAECPTVDSTSFDMNAHSFDAFGVEVADTSAEKTKTKDAKMPGTGYELSKLFKSEPKPASNAAMSAQVPRSVLAAITVVAVAFRFM